MKDFIVTYGEAVQVSSDDYSYIRTIKIFKEDASLSDILNWLKSLGVRQPCITMVDFSVLDKRDAHK